MQVPPIHVQPGNVGTDLNAAEVTQRARIAGNAAGNRPAKVYISCGRGCAEREVAANAARPYAATRLVRARIRRTPDERSRLRQERRVGGVNGGNKAAHIRDTPATAATAA